MKKAAAVLSFDRVDLDRFHFHAKFLEPRDRAFDFVALPTKRQGDEPNFIRDAGLPDVGNDLEFLSEFPNDRPRDQSRGKHQPEA